MPRARSTSAGPPVKTWAVSWVMIERCDATNLAAGKPATGPSAAHTTGTVANASIQSRLSGDEAVKS